jgi:phosphoglycerate kinase
MDAVLSFTRLQDLIDRDALKNKRVFIRADLNVPQDDAGNITEDTRIRASVPAIRAALKAGAAVMVTSHLGRPTEGEFKPEDSLAPVAARLSELLGQPVELKQDWVDGVDVAPGQVVLLENCRVNKGEKKNDDELAQKMAKLCDVYVNDAFGTAHRAEATTHGIAKFAPVVCAGPLLAAELDALGKALGQPAASAAGHRRRLEGVEQAVDPAEPGRQGRQPDRRRRHRQHLHEGRRPEHRQVAGRNDLVGEAKADHRHDERARRLGADSRSTSSARKSFRRPPLPPSRTWQGRGDDDMILDIGPKTAAMLAEQVAKAGTIVWNGPVGVFEFDQFAEGTKTLAHGDCPLERLLDCRRWRHPGGDCQIQDWRQDRLYLDRRRRLPRIPRR